MVKNIIGHKNPDTDSVCSAIVYSNYLNNKGEEAKAYTLGELNRETKFLLEKFEVKFPQIINTLDEGSEVILIDHNEKKQAIDGIDKLKVTKIIDHHKFSIDTVEPLYIRAEPIGSTCSIIAKILFENNVEINQVDASLLISAIISDTLYFRSPTTTQEDKDIIEKLNKIAKIQNLEEFSLEMFAAKSDLGDIDVEKLIKLDYKTFSFAGLEYGIGVMETTSPEYGLNRKDEIVSKMREIKKQDNLAGILFSIIDLISICSKISSRL